VLLNVVTIRLEIELYVKQNFLIQYCALWESSQRAFKTYNKISMHFCVLVSGGDLRVKEKNE